MLPTALKPGFEKFRRQSSPSARADLDLITLKLWSLRRKTQGEDYLGSFAHALALAAPTLRSQEHKAIAFYALCVLCDPAARNSMLSIARPWNTAANPASAPSGASGSNSPSIQDLMTATEQMQIAQMSFNLQYLMLQEEIQNDSRQYNILSEVMKTRFDTMKGILGNLK